MLNKMLNIKYPIIQGAMAHIATAEFAAAVSECGGLGIIATGGMTVEDAQREIRKCRSLTDKPFGVNIMLMNPNTPEMIEMICAEQVAAVTTGAGNPGPYMELLKSSGAKVFPVVPSVALARRMERCGADAVIVEGGESGGHVGEQTTMALVPQVADAVSIPVIAAGGIADGRGFNAALALGAVGVQIGTCLLAAEECPVHPNYKQAVIKAGDTDTVVTGRSIGTPVRIRKNKMSRRYAQLEKSGADKEQMEMLTLGALRKAVKDGDVDNGSVMMGQIAGLCREIKPVQEILDRIITQSQTELTNLQQKLEKI